MYQSQVANEVQAALPSVWIPTRGNDIPPHAIPLHERPNASGQLYIARGLLGDEMHLGTTSYASIEGAQLQDRYGRSHAVFEYEVLVCTSSLRFQLESQQPLTPAPETPRTTSQRPVRSDSVPTSRSLPPKKTPWPGVLAPLPWLSAPHGQPALLPKVTGKKRLPDNPPPCTSPGRTNVFEHPRPVALSSRENVQLEHFAQSKCFILIDDTPSMQRSWSQTRMALGGFVDILSLVDTWEGLDVKFLHHAQARHCIKAREEFEVLFDSVPTWGDKKVMTAKVTQVFEESLPIIHETQTPRPAVLLIITDGIATDTQELLNAMLHICQRLDGKHVPPQMFRIHILQMGDDRKAVKPLHDFRDRISQRDHDRRILNVVSYHRGRGLLNAQNIFKLLLASTQLPEEEDPDFAERQSAEAITAQYGELEKIRAIGTKRQLT